MSTKKPEPIEILHSLDTIHRKIVDWLQERPIQNDIASLHFIINGWPFVTMAYPLLEQSLKALVMVQDESYAETEMRKDSHSLNTVFGRINGKDAERLRKGYRAFQSLHSYISYRTLDEFMGEIDTDYVKWRYFPLEGWKNGQPAKTSVEAMLEVSQQALDALTAQVVTDHGLRTVGGRLELQFADLLVNQANARLLQGNCPGLVEVTNNWLKEHKGSYLNGISKMVWNGEPVRFQVETELADLMEDFFERLYSHKDGDTQQFLRRAKTDSSPLVWDVGGSVFTNDLI